MKRSFAASASASASAAATGPPSRRQAKQEQQEQEDARLLTLHLALQALSGSHLTVERRDGDVIEGTLRLADEHMKCAHPAESPALSSADRD